MQDRATMPAPLPVRDFQQAATTANTSPEFAGSVSWVPRTSLRWAAVALVVLFIGLSLSLAVVGAASQSSQTAHGLQRSAAAFPASPLSLVATPDSTNVSGSLLLDHNHAENKWCSYGTLPGVWVSAVRGAGRNPLAFGKSSENCHWQLLDKQCPLSDQLSLYMPRAAPDSAFNDSSPHIASARSDSGKDGFTILNDAAATPPTLALSPTQAASQAASILFISDSVDRHIITYLCEHTGGRIKALILKSALNEAYGQAPVDVSSLTTANLTSYVINTCVSQTSLRLAATYFPGVHPTGPFFKQRRMNYKQRIDHAALVWRSYSPTPPDLVVVSSMLWDLARMSTYEPHWVSGMELSLDLLSAWMANYTQVVNYARAAFPQAGMFAYHTTIFPKFDPHTGIMERTYLGRRVFVQQMNAAGWHVASQLGLEVLDYEQLGARFMEGQSYLVDMIHPGPEIGLELANMYLNYVAQLRSQPPGWSHPSTHSQPS